MNNYDKSTNFEKIKAILDSGHKAKVEFSSWNLSKKKVDIVNEILTDELNEEYIRSFIDNRVIVNITPIPTKPPILPVGTEVVVLENVDTYSQGYIGKVGNIKKVYDDNSGISYFIEFTNGTDIEYYHTTRLFPHYCICANYLD